MRRAYNFGPPEGSWTETLAAWAIELRVDTFVLWAKEEAQVEHFAAEVVPAVREAAAG